MRGSDVDHRDGESERLDGGGAAIAEGNAGSPIAQAGEETAHALAGQHRDREFDQTLSPDWRPHADDSLLVAPLSVNTVSASATLRATGPHQLVEAQPSQENDDRAPCSDSNIDDIIELYQRRASHSTNIAKSSSSPGDSPDLSGDSRSSSGSSTQDGSAPSLELSLGTFSSTPPSSPASAASSVRGREDNPLTVCWRSGRSERSR